MAKTVNYAAVFLHLQGALVNTDQQSHHCRSNLFQLFCFGLCPSQVNNPSGKFSKNMWQLGNLGAVLEDDKAPNKIYGGHETWFVFVETQKRLDISNHYLQEKIAGLFVACLTQSWRYTKSSSFPIIALMSGFQRGVAINVWSETAVFQNAVRLRI